MAGIQARQTQGRAGGRKGGAGPRQREGGVRALFVSGTTRPGRRGFLVSFRFSYFFPTRASVSETSCSDGPEDCEGNARRTRSFEGPTERTVAVPGWPQRRAWVRGGASIPQRSAPCGIPRKQCCEDCAETRDMNRVCPPCSSRLLCCPKRHCLLPAYHRLDRLAACGRLSSSFVDAMRSDAARTRPGTCDSAAGVLLGHWAGLLGCWAAELPSWCPPTVGDSWALHCLGCPSLGCLKSPLPCLFPCNLSPVQASSRNRTRPTRHDLSAELGATRGQLFGFTTYLAS
jgi:hypothetical protein